MLVKTIAVWLLLLLLAISNGFVREKFIEPGLGEYPAHVISSLMLSAIILVVSFAFVSLTRFTRLELLEIGGIWLGLTVGFEFIFGHFFAGKSWHTLFADYNVFKGRIWLLVLLTTVLSPLFWGSVLQKTQV